MEAAVLGRREGDLRGQQADRLLGRQLLRGVARRGRGPRARETSRSRRTRWPWLIEPATVKVFDDYDVLSERELQLALRGVAGAVHHHDQHRGRDGRLDRPHDAPARRDPLASRRCSRSPARGVARLAEESSALVDEFTDALLRVGDRETRDHPEDEFEDLLGGARYGPEHGSRRP